MKKEYECFTCKSKFKRQFDPRQNVRYCSNNCRFTWKKSSEEEKEKRIKELIDRNVDKSSGCWVWKGYKGKLGYSVVHYDNKPMQGHRASYLIYKGNIPKELQVCHTCDNRACLNPEHLYLGSAKDNARDRDQRGRKASTLGSKNGNNKLCENQVVQIKKMLNEGKTLPEIAKYFPVTKSNIWCIKKGISWSHVNVIP